MSFQAMTWAVEQELQLKEKMTLLMMANHCNHHTGQCNPSLSRLAKECGMGKTALLSAIKSLENKNYLRVIRKQIGDVHLPNQYELNFDWGSTREEPPSTRRDGGSPSHAQGVVREADINQEYKPVIQPKSIVVVTQGEISKKLKLTEEQQACFEWAKTQSYWISSTVYIENFLQIYAKPSKRGLKAQFEASKVIPQGVPNGTHQQTGRKLSALERFERANGLGDYATDDTTSVIDCEDYRTIV